MSGVYVKLFGSLLNSSVWCADGVTKIVWITLLLLADAEGYVWGAVPGIARQAGVEPEACRRSLDYLTSPDPDSRTQDEAGRRIVPVDGGWRIVNARKYREMQTNGQRLASERSKRYRDRRASVTKRDVRDASRTSRTEGEGEPEGEKRKRTTPAAAGAARGPRGRRPPGNGNDARKEGGRPGWVARAGDMLKARRGGTADYGRIGRELADLVREHGEEEVLARWARYIDGPTYFGPHVFATDFGRWVDGGAPSQTAAARATVGEASSAAVARFIQRGERRS